MSRHRHYRRRVGPIFSKFVSFSLIFISFCLIIWGL
ncbi:hypothetical protein BVRB_6g155610 [Beta vulgaris subsp. vulgaris]|uniref:Uncharacterized protein n=1 Tax=Beta vulgaris subsp. vulgaris TaxID=3555 RepID=A0A0J8BBR5_BETVV|nr:hypothetical protein BVRB_6g155610 [Beta vulgaris subsp. vulgaris]